MSVDWSGYEPYPDVGLDLNELPRVEARQVYKRCMATKEERIEGLRALVRTGGVELDSSDRAVQALNDWFLADVRADPDRPGRMLPIWYSVAHDIGLFLGEVMIARHPGLRWEFFTWGKKSIDYQKHVIMGFGTENPKHHTSADPCGAVTGYGHQIIIRRGSVPTYGVVTVRGVRLDLDEIMAKHHNDEVDTDEFVDSLRIAARRAGQPDPPAADEDQPAPGEAPAPGVTPAAGPTAPG
ncbi:MAG: hypothetical protein FWD74_01360 [Actinomycetia bacterium]|nr:hypothetical protein [Actinomycetes bacterium]